MLRKNSLFEQTCRVFVRQWATGNLFSNFDKASKAMGRTQTWFEQFTQPRCTHWSYIFCRTTILVLNGSDFWRFWAKTTMIAKTFRKFYLATKRWGVGRVVFEYILLPAAKRGWTRSELKWKKWVFCILNSQFLKSHTKKNRKITAKETFFPRFPTIQLTHIAPF